VRDRARRSGRKGYLTAANGLAKSQLRANIRISLQVRKGPGGDLPSWSTCDDLDSERVVGLQRPGSSADGARTTCGVRLRVNR
jgi:hypothetical protein